MKSKQTVTLKKGDCVKVMRGLDDNSVDSIVTDPPYELGFMGKGWDKSSIANSVELWAEALRVLKPGGHMLAFSGSRTYHRMVCAIEDAGFEIRDQIMWVYGSGFPKSYNVAKGIEGMLTTGSCSWNAWRDLPGEKVRQSGGLGGLTENQHAQGYRPKNYGKRASVKLHPTTDAARQWQGWGTALKPAHEPIVVARKPLQGTVAQNVQKWGTGALNIDGCRVASGDTIKAGHSAKTPTDGWDRPWRTDEAALKSWRERKDANATKATELGRWPANLIHDGLPQEWARFFYCAKASKADRGEGNTHPTVKPRALMEYLCRLVTPPGGTILDPFLGSGSTGIGAALGGFSFIGCDLSAEYVEISRRRIAAARKKPAQRALPFAKAA